MDKHYNKTKYAPMAKIKNRVYIGYYPEHEVGGLLKIGETEQVMKKRAQGIKSHAKEDFKVLLYVEYETPHRWAKTSRVEVESYVRYRLARRNNKLHWIDSKNDHFYYNIETQEIDEWVRQFRKYVKVSLKHQHIKTYQFKTLE